MADDPIEGLYDPTKFHFARVPEVLVRHEHDDRSRPAHVAPISLPLADGKTGSAVAVFSDQDLANRFVTGQGEKGAGLAMGRPRDWQELIRWLTHAEQEGATHVVADPGPRPGRSHWCAPIGTVLRELREQHPE